MKVDTQELRLSAERASPRVRVRGGFVVYRTISSLDANSQLPGVTVLGSFTRGGAPRSPRRRPHGRISRRRPSSGREPVARGAQAQP